MARTGSARQGEVWCGEGSVNEDAHDWITRPLSWREEQNIRTFDPTAGEGGGQGLYGRMQAGLVGTSDPRLGGICLLTMTRADVQDMVGLRTHSKWRNRTGGFQSNLPVVAFREFFPPAPLFDQGDEVSPD